MVIFSTRELYPRLSEAEALLPAVIFNIGRYPDRLFFGATKDDHGHYHGFWPHVDMKFNEWMHVAVTVEGKRE
jgi:hypothetical protein